MLLDRSQNIPNEKKSEKNFAKEMVKQQFRNQKGGQRRQTLANFKRYLNEFSGGDQLELIAAYMASNEGKKKQKERNENHIDEKLKTLVGILKKQHEMAIVHEKRRSLSMVCKILTMEQLQKLGWKINSHSFRSARKHYEEYGAGSPVPKPNIPPSKQRNSELPLLVSEFFYLDEITRDAPNKFTNVNQVSLL
jgi:hypothetical protein